MTLKEIMAHVNGEVIACKESLDHEVNSAFGSDLMSDVLAYVEENTLLITGLINQQVIRTAEMLDLKAILFVRGKVPCEEVIELAEEKEIVLMTTRHTLFTVSGILYKEGLKGLQI
jgi:predicted transcriptional regulator